MSQLPLSHPIQLAEVPPAGLEVVLQPDAAACAALAAHAGVLGLSGLTARFLVAQEGAGGLHVTGAVDAMVRQTCGVTLDPFDAPLHEPVDVHFAPAGTARAADMEEDEGYDPPDEIVDGAIDLGALTTEFLTLGIDPYPRKPGAVFEPPPEGPGNPSPFSALSKLKRDE